MISKASGGGMTSNTKDSSGAKRQREARRCTIWTYLVLCLLAPRGHSSTVANPEINGTPLLLVHNLGTRYNTRFRNCSCLRNKAL